jgi:hypothetical protein
MTDLPTLQAAIDAPTPATRALLFAQLANAKAAVRAKAAEGLLALYAAEKAPAPRAAGLARDFGSDPEAILGRPLDELRALIGEPTSAAWTRFVASLEMNLDSWRDGTGYDLGALREMGEIERGAIGEMIATRLANRNRAADWRDLEAAAELGRADAIARRTDDDDPQTRLRARVALGDTTAIVAELCATIGRGRDVDAVSRALDRVAEHPTAAVREALIARVRKVDSLFIVASMVLLEVFGGVEDAFGERPFLFEVQAQGPDGDLMERLIARAKGSDLLQR